MKDMKEIREAMLTLLRENDALKKQWEELKAKQPNDLNGLLHQQLDMAELEDRGRSTGAMGSALAWALDEPLITVKAFDMLLVVVKARQEEEGYASAVPSDFVATGSRPAYQG